jgi:hypothetical protein
MTEKIQKKEKKSALKGIVASGIAGVVTGALCGTIDGFFDGEIFSNPGVPLSVGLGTSIISNPSKELGQFQRIADTGSSIAGYYIGYPIAKSIIKYLKQ